MELKKDMPKKSKSSTNDKQVQTRRRSFDLQCAVSIDQCDMCSVLPALFQDTTSERGGGLVRMWPSNVFFFLDTLSLLLLSQRRLKSRLETEIMRTMFQT